MNRGNDHQSLVHEIDRRSGDLEELTRELVAIPTLNPPGLNYREICEYLGRRLRPHGFFVEILRAKGAIGDSDRYPRWNLVARHEGGEAGPCVHFNSHTDVVAVGQGWTTDPFGGQTVDGRIYGRGTCDMKGGLAASVVAAEAFLTCFPRYRGAIEISATADEESGGYAGVAWLAEKGYFSPARVQHVIIPEPLNKDRICLGHRGLWWATIETRGRIAHGSMPFLGDCAVRHMGAVLNEFERNLYPALAERQTSMPVVPPAARQSSLNLNALHGGEPEQEEGYSGFPSSCVPDRCRMQLDRRFLAEESFEAVRKEIIDVLETVAASRPGFDYRLEDMYHVPPVMTKRDAPVVKVLAGAISAILDVEPEYVVSPGTYDQKHIDRIGKMKNCIAYGPGILDLAHQPDEWIAIKDMADSAKVMAVTMQHLLCPSAD